MHTNTLLKAGVASAPVFIFLAIMTGALSLADGYNPLLHPVSALALGKFGWLQEMSFFLTSGLVFLFAFGLWRVLKPKKFGFILFTLVSIGLLIGGLFQTSPLNGYPIGTPLVPTEFTLHGQLHNLGAGLVFIDLFIGGLLFARFFKKRGDSKFAIISAVCGIATIVFLFISSIAYTQVPGLVEFAGLYQRLAIFFGFGWMSLLASHLLNHPLHSTHR